MPLHWLRTKAIRWTVMSAWPAPWVWWTNTAHPALEQPGRREHLDFAIESTAAASRHPSAIYIDCG
jgi:hypothetical protein